MRRPKANGRASVTGFSSRGLNAFCNASFSYRCALGGMPLTKRSPLRNHEIRKLDAFECRGGECNASTFAELADPPEFGRAVVVPFLRRGFVAATRTFCNWRLACEAPATPPDLTTAIERHSETSFWLARCVSQFSNCARTNTHRRPTLAAGTRPACASRRSVSGAHWHRVAAASRGRVSMG